MKRYALLLVSAASLFACNGQQSKDAKKVAEGIQTTMKEHTPGSIATSASGYSMKCKIDGKEWVAVSMMPIEGIDRVIGYIEDGGYIGIPGITKNIQQGSTFTLGKTYNADLNIVDDKTLVDKDGNVILLDIQNGKCEITKRDGEWIEGTFYFTAGSSKSDKKIAVTEGTFRVK